MEQYVPSTEEIMQVHKFHRDWDTDFIIEMLQCSIDGGKCIDPDKHNYDECDSCGVCFYGR